MFINETDVQFVLKNQFIQYKDLFIKNFNIQEYPRDYIFNTAGFSNKGLYYLVEGTIYVYTTNIHGYVRFMGIHQENTIFNLDSFRDQDDAVITTQAFSSVKVIPLTIDQIIELSKQDSQLYKDFLIYTADVLRLMCHDAQAQSVHDVKTRFIHFILLYTKNTNSSVIPLSQYRIASAINASRIQVTRICSELKQLDLIDIHRNQIVIIDRERLAQYSYYL